MRTWHMSHGKDGWAVTAYEVPAWRHTLEQIGQWSSHHVFGGLFCCRIPKWAGNVPVGRPVRGRDGSVDNSLDYAMWRFGQRLFNLGEVWRRTTNRTQSPITVEQARAIDPGWVAEVERLVGEGLYEDDEPTAAVAAAFDAGEKNVTGR